MNKVAVMTFASALTATAAFAAVANYNPANAPKGTHLQSGNPDCTVTGFVVECNSYELAGVGNKDAVASLSATYSGTVICTNPAGNVAPGQTKYPTLTTSTGSLSPENGRLTVPALSSTTDQTTIEGALVANTKCPNPRWNKYVQPGSIELVGYLYTLTFKGFSGPYITISG